MRKTALALIVIALAAPLGFTACDRTTSETTKTVTTPDGNVTKETVTKTTDNNGNVTHEKETVINK